MKRVQFIASRDGLGHLVRCAALADELKKRGWVENGEPDVIVVDDPLVQVETTGKVVRIIDVPTSDPADLYIQGRDLVREEFRMSPWRGGTQILNVMNVKDMSAQELARALSTAYAVVTYGGMRAMEAACVGVPLVMIPRNEGERRNVEYISGGGRIDGFGCQRAADAIEELVK